MKELTYKFDDFKNTDTMMRFRFKAWRQIKGWSRSYVKEYLGKGADIYKFERPDGAASMGIIWRMINELGVDPEFLTTGRYGGIKNNDVIERLKVLMDAGQTLTDKEATKLLSEAGLSRLIDLK